MNKKLAMILGTFAQVGLWIITYIQMYLLATVITCSILGFIVLIVSVFSTVPAILSSHFWILFLVVSIPLSVILMIVVIVKYNKENKAAKLAKASREAQKEN